VYSRRRLFASRLRTLFTARRCDRKLEDELQTHISLLAERYAAQGVGREEARDAARRQFGNLTLVKESNREMRIFPQLEMFSRDARHGARLLLRSPGLAAAALLTLALGIGASTAIFSLVRGILLRPLPYADAGRIVVPATIFSRYDTDRGSVAWADIRDWKSQRDLFDSVSAMNQGDVDITGGEETERAPGLIADEEYFRAMGAPPLIGRFFTAEENVPDAGRVAVLSYRFWMRRFGGDPAAVGSRIEIGGDIGN
jgi:putative ABC transport system permease protein